MTRHHPLLVLALLTACSGTDFTSSSRKSGAPPKSPLQKDQVKDEVDSGEKDDGGHTRPPAKTPSPPSDQDDPSIDVNACYPTSGGKKITSVKISGENCINNTIDPGGADFDDYFVTVSGNLLREGWQLFAAEDQDLEISYNLGTPFLTTQTVRLQVVNCDGEQQGQYDVSSGTGSTTLKAKKGDRFNIVTTVLSGCYDRHDEYDLLRDKDKAFKMP